MKITFNNATATDLIESFDVVVKLRPQKKMSENEFFAFCQKFDVERIEQTADGEIIIMPPTVWSTGRKNASLTVQLGIWAKKDGRGETADSNAGYILPNGATRSPDASWILRERLQKLKKKQLDKFLPLCPDFVVELTSPSDSLKDVKEKMIEYIENGAQLGWLIHSKTKQVFIYRPNAAPEVLDNPQTVSGEPLLTGFTLDLSEIW